MEKTNQINPLKTSIGLTKQDQLMLDHLCKTYDLNRTALIRHLIIKEHSILKNKNEDK